MNGLASYEAIEKQDRYKKIDLEPEDIEKLKNDVEYWKREAIRMAAEPVEVNFQTWIHGILDNVRKQYLESVKELSRPRLQ